MGPELKQAPQPKQGAIIEALLTAVNRSIEGKTLNAEEARDLLEYVKNTLNEHVKNKRMTQNQADAVYDAIKNKIEQQSSKNEVKYTALMLTSSERRRVEKRVDALALELQSVFYIGETGSAVALRAQNARAAYESIGNEIERLAQEKAIPGKDLKGFRQREMKTAMDMLNSRIDFIMPEQLAKLCKDNLIANDFNTVNTFATEYAKAFAQVQAVDAVMRSYVFGMPIVAGTDAKEILLAMKGITQSGTATKEDASAVSQLLRSESGADYKKAVLAVLYGNEGEVLEATANNLNVRATGKAYEKYIGIVQKLVENRDEAKKQWDEAKRSYAQATDYIQNASRTRTSTQNMNEYTARFDIIGTVAYANWASKLAKTKVSEANDAEILGLIKGEGTYGDAGGLLAMPSYYQALVFDNDVIGEAIKATREKPQRQQIMNEVVSSINQIYTLSSLKYRSADIAKFVEETSGMRNSGSLGSMLENRWVNDTDGTLRVNRPLETALYRVDTGSSVSYFTQLLNINLNLNIEQDLGLNSDEVRRFLGAWPNVYLGSTAPRTVSYLRDNVPYEDIIGYLVGKKQELLAGRGEQFRLSNIGGSGSLLEREDITKQTMDSLQANIGGRAGESAGFGYSRTDERTALNPDGSYGQQTINDRITANATNAYFDGVKVYDLLYEHFKNKQTAADATVVDNKETVARLNAVGLGANIVFDGFYRSTKDGIDVEDTNVYLYDMKSSSWYRINIDKAEFKNNPELKEEISHVLARGGNVPVAGVRASAAVEQYKDENGELKGFLFGWSSKNFANVNVVTPTNQRAFATAYAPTGVSKDGHATVVSAAYFDLVNAEELAATDRVVKRGQKTKETRGLVGDWLIMDKFRATGIVGGSGRTTVAGTGKDNYLIAGQVLTPQAGASAAYRFNQGAYEFRSDAGAQFGRLSAAAYYSKRGTGEQQVKDMAGGVTIDLVKGYTLQILGRQPGTKMQWPLSEQKRIANGLIGIASEMEEAKKSEDFNTREDVRQAKILDWSQRVALLMSDVRSYAFTKEVMNMDNNFAIKLNTPASSWTMVASPIQETDGSKTLLTGIYERDIGSGFAVMGGFSYLGREPSKISTRTTQFGGVYYRTDRLKVGGMVFAKEVGGVETKGAQIEGAVRTKTGQVGASAQTFGMRGIGKDYQIEVFDEFGRNRVQIDHTSMERLRSFGASYGYIISEALRHTWMMKVGADTAWLRGTPYTFQGVTGQLSWQNPRGVTVSLDVRYDQTFGGGSRVKNTSGKLTFNIPF